MVARRARLTADAAIADPANTGDAATPASIASSATPIASTDDIANDFLALVGAYIGGLETPYIWMRPDLAAQAGIRVGGVGAGAALGVRGGLLAGIPVCYCEGIPGDSSGSPMIMLDRASVALMDEGFEIKRSMHTTLEMSDAPSGATDTPPSSGTGTKMVSLFQSGAPGLQLVRRVNWHLEPTRMPSL